jgi:hypothetical protein
LTSVSLLAAALVSAAAALPTAPLATPPSPTLRAARRQGPIVLDGKLDEPAWQLAEEGKGFTQVQPEEGKPSPVDTRFRVLWDSEYLYIGVQCFDPEPVVAYLSRRDRYVEGDRIDIDIETTRDRRSAYHFSVYAAGQQLDALHFDDTSMTTDWDAAWESAVDISPAGWSAELKIPLRSLRIPEGATAFGFQIARLLSRRHEEARWKFVPNDTPGYVSAQMGLVTGLDGIQPVRALELRPYLAARATRTVPSPGEVASPARLDACASIGITKQGLAATCAGLDLRYNLSSDLSFVATVNPDFGQVEADQRVLNLTTFETFFPEKRPFFLEGLDLFKPPVRADFGGPYGGDPFQLFYSRRLGRPPPAPVDPFGNTLTPLYEPSARPVAEALKVTGSIGGATVGLLSALEPRVSAQLLGDGGQVSDQRVAEAVHSAAGRLRVPVGQNALLGFTGTAVDPLFSEASGGSRHAHTGGADLVAYDSARDWNFQGQLAGSLLNGGPIDVQRDGTVLGDGSAGLAGSAKFSKEGGALIGLAQIDYISPQFTANDLGFMRRGNLLRTFAGVVLRDVHPSEKWQFARLFLAARHVRNAAFEVPLETDVSLEGNITFNNFWNLYGGLFYGPHGYDDRELLDGTPFERPGGVVFYGSVSSDTRRDFSAELDWQYARGVASQFYDSVNPTLILRIRPKPFFEMELDLAAQVQRGDIRAIRAASTPTSAGGDPTQTLDPRSATLSERLYLFAPQDSRTMSGILRATLAFTPRLTLQAYAQLFTAGVTYHAPLRYLAEPGKGRIHLDDLAPALPEDQAPNNDDRQAGLNINLILRWEWALGSTFYLVYSHATGNDFVPPSRGLDFSRELDAAFQRGAIHGDTLLAKIDLLRAL